MGMFDKITSGRKQSATDTLGKVSSFVSGSQPAQPQEWNTMSMLGRIYEIGMTDPTQASELMSTFRTLQQDKTSQFYNPYSAPTNRAIQNLAAYGVDTSVIDDKFYNDNNYLMDYLIYDGTSNTPTKPSAKKATAEQKAAYEFYQIWKSEEATKKAEKQWDDLQSELRYWAGRDDLNYSDDKIISMIDWSKYGALTDMDNEEKRLAQPTEYNRAIGYSKDALYGVLWQARNPDYDGDLYGAMANSYNGVGNTWQYNEEIAKKLDPQSEEYHPYSVGMTNLDEASKYFNMKSFPASWVADHEYMAFSDDPTEKKMYGYVRQAYENRTTAEAEYNALIEDVNKKANYKKSAEDVLASINWSKYPTLVKMDKSIGQRDFLATGDLVPMTEALKYRYADLENYLNDVYAKKKQDADAEYYANLNKIRSSIMNAKGAGPIKNEGAAEHPTYRPTEEQKEVANAYNSLLYEDADITGDISTPAEKAVNDTQLSILYEPTKSTFGDFKTNIPASTKALFDKAESSNITTYSGTILKNFDTIADYERNEELIPELEAQEEKLRAQIGDDLARRVALETAEFDKETFWDNGGRVQDQPTWNLLSDESKQKLLNLQDIEGPEQMADYYAYYLEQDSKMPEGATTELEEDVAKYRQVYQNLEDANAAREQGLASYDEAKKNIEENQRKQDETIAMMKEAGLDTKDMEDAETVTDFFLNFTKYSPTKWSQYNFYHAVSQMYISGATGKDTLFRDAEQGDAEIQEAIDVARTMLDYADEKGYDLPANVRENVTRYIESLERQHQDFEYLSLLKNEDFDAGVEKGIKMAETNAAFDWDAYAEGGLEALPLWGTLSPEQQQRLTALAEMSDPQLQEQYEYAIRQMNIGNRVFGPYQLKDLLTDYEEKTYYYLLGTQGVESAEEYASHLTDASYGVMNSRAAEQTKQAAEDTVGSGRLLAQALSILLAPVQAAANIYYNAEVGLAKLRGERVEYNPNNINLSANIYKKEARAKINESIINQFGENDIRTKLLTGLHEIISTRGDSLANALVYGPLFSGIGSNIAREFFSALPMAVTAATDAVADAKERGVADDLNLLGIFASTLLAESITEGVSLDNMRQAFQVGNELTSEGLRGFFENWLTRAGVSEMLGETLTEIVEQECDRAFAGENSEYNQLVEKFKQENPNISDREAELMAAREQFGQVLHTALISYLTPGADIIQYATGRYMAYRDEARYRQENDLENASILDVYREYRDVLRYRREHQNEGTATETETTAPAEQPAAPEAEAEAEVPAVEEISPAEKEAQQNTLDFEILETAKEGDVSAQTASVASVLDTANTPESSDAASAAAANMTALFGEGTTPAEGMQDLIVGAFASGVSTEAVKRAVETAALSESSEARKVIQSAKYQSADPATKAEMVAATVAVDANNADVQNEISTRVRANRVARAEKAALQDAQVRALHDAASKALVAVVDAQQKTQDAQTELDKKDEAVGIARDNLIRASSNDTGSDTDSAIIGQAIDALKNATAVADEYDQRLKNAKAAEQRAQEEASKAMEELATTKRQVAESIVEEEDRKRAQTRTAQKAQNAIDQAQAEERQAEQDMTESANTADVEAFIDQVRKENPTITEEQIQQIRERFAQRVAARIQNEPAPENQQAQQTPVRRVRTVMDENGNIDPQAQKIADRINQKFNVPVVFVKDITEGGNKVLSEGYYDKKNHRIVISGNVSLDVAMKKVLPHELLHSLEQSKTYTPVVNSLLRIMYGDDADIEKAIANLEKNGGKATSRLEQDILHVKQQYDAALKDEGEHDYRYAAQEIAAKRMGEMFYDPSNPARSQELIDRLVKENPSVAKQIMNGIKSMIKKALGMRGAWVSNAQRTVDMFESALKGNTVADGKTTPTAQVPSYTVTGTRSDPRHVGVRFISDPGEAIDQALTGLGMKKNVNDSGLVTYRSPKTGPNVTEAAVQYAIKQATKQTPGENKYLLNPLKKVSETIIEKIQYIADQSPFAKEFKAWNKKQDSTALLTVGRPSPLLMKYGVPDADVKISGGKIIDIRQKHPAMTDNVIRQIPSILENPILIMKSRTRGNDTITIFGELVDKNGYPVLAALSIDPTLDEKTGTEFVVLRSAYGKDQNPQGFIDKSTILYTDETRADAWAATIGLQLPSGHTQIDSSSNMLPLGEKDVKSSLPEERIAIPAAKDSNGDALTGTLDGDTEVKYSLSSWTEDERKRVRENLIGSGFTEEEADQWIANVDSIAAVIAADRDRLDFTADPEKTMLKPNAEYVKTLDASTLCAKRLLYQGTFNAIQHLLPNTPLMPQDLIDLANMMREMGYEVPCGICYVESRRRSLGKFASEWLESYDGEYKPTLDQVTTSDGLEELRKTHPQAYQDFINAMNKKGTMNPKVVQLRTDYRGEVSKMTPAQIQKVKDIGGLRIQSFSDFETPHLLDMTQAVMDMAAAGLTAQAYTKVPNFAWVFGDTGVKINLSLIGRGTGLDENGNLIFDDVEGMPIEEAIKLRTRYSKNVGTILVGMNDEHIIAAMADGRIDFIIPFHKSGWSQAELDRMPVLNSYTDYTNSQNEKAIVGRTKDGGYKTESLDKSKRVNFQPVGENGYWDFTKSGRENAETYLRMCAEDGRVPKFAQFLVDNGDGTFSLPQGDDARSTAIREGYWKLLIDFKMYDNDGNGSPQTAVTPNINMEQAMRVLNEYSLERNGISRQDNNSLPVAEPVVERFVEQYKETHPIEPGQRYSLPSDAEYLSAVERGEMDKAQEDVDRTAEEAGYTEKAYHGTGEFGFTEFDMDKGNGMIFVAYDKKMAGTYAESDEADVTDISKAIKTSKPIKEMTGQEVADLAKRYLTEIEGDKIVSMEYHPDSDTYTVVFSVGNYFAPGSTQTQEMTRMDMEYYLNREIQKRKSNVYQLYTRPGNQLVIDADGATWDEIPVPFSDRTMDTREVAEWAKANGYDSVRIDNLWDSGMNGSPLDGYGSIGIFFNQTDVKSADTVTYDDEGNIIPPSQRFNSEEPDIRYSLPSDDILDQQIDEYLDRGGISAPPNNPTPPSGNPPANTPSDPRYGYRQWGNEGAQQSDELDERVKEIVFNSEYAKDTNAAELARAVAWIRSNKQYADDDGFQESFRRVTSKRFNASTKDGQARLIAVMAMAVARGDVNAQSELAIAYNQSGTPLAQALQARKLFALMTPLGRVATLQKMLSQVREQTGNENITLSDWIIQAASEASDPKEFQKIREAAAIELADQIPASWRDRLRGIRMLSMLGNPRTHIRNIIGNALFVPVVSLKNKLGAIAETLTHQENRTKTLAVRLNGEIRDFVRQDAEFMRDELTGEAKYNEGNLVQRNQTPFNGFMQRVIDFNSNALEGEDWFFLRGHYRRALGGWIAANGYTIDQLKANPDLLNEGRAYAIQEAQKATYRDFNGVAEKMNQLSRNPQTNGQRVVGFLTDAVLPFKKTPANILKRGIEYSPAGIVRGLFNLATGVRNGTITPTQAIDRICSGLAGTAVMALGYFLAHSGMATVDFDDDEGKFEEEQGNQKYSIRVNLFGQDVTLTMDWAAPMSMPFFVGAAIYNQLSKQGDFDVNEVINAFANIFEPVLNLSMLDGVNTLFKTSQNSDTNTMTQIGAKILSNYATSYVPSLLGAIARTVDDTRRANFVESGQGTGLTGTYRYAREQVENKIPGLSQTNIPVRDVFGNPETSSLAERIFENFILPGYISNYKNDPVLNEMDRLYSANVTDSKSMVPKDPAKTIEYKGEKHVLSAEEWDKYKTVRGQTAYKMLNDLIGTSAYKQADAAAQVQMMKKCWEYADKVGKQAVVPEYEVGDKGENPVQTITKEGKIVSCNNQLIQALQQENYEAVETMIEALRREEVEDTDIKETIAKKYRDKYKEAYRKGQKDEMFKVMELLEITGFDYDFDGWEEQVDEKYGR